MHRIALALSGGGARAIAFHLGCLRGLHKLRLLDSVTIVSAVSGGSVLAALYCSAEGDFEEFDRRAVRLLSTGLVSPSIWTAISTFEALRAALDFMILAADRILATVIKAIFLIVGGPAGNRWFAESYFRRSASRTTILQRAFNKFLAGKQLAHLRTDRPALVIIGCELRAKAAIYFTKSLIHCWRYGSSSAEGVDLAKAVAVSAAYPLLLPAIEEDMLFMRDGQSSLHRVVLTDGGIYDNLGLGPLLPGRDPSISYDVGSYDRLIVCRAGYSLEPGHAPSFIVSRLIAAFEAVFARSQNMATNRLYDLHRAREIGEFLYVYLGQNDGLLTVQPPDLVSREDVAGYPTNFSAMSTDWIDRLSRRGEQLVETLAKQHWAIEADHTK